MFPCCCYLVTLSFLTLCNPGDCSPPGSSAYGILQARILEWIAISFSRGSSWTRGRTCGSRICRGVLYHWATWEDQCFPRALDYPVSCIHECTHTLPLAAEMTRMWSSQGGGWGERRRATWWELPRIRLPLGQGMVLSLFPCPASTSDQSSTYTVAFSSLYEMKLHLSHFPS